MGGQDGMPRGRRPEGGQRRFFLWTARVVSALQFGDKVDGSVGVDVEEEEPEHDGQPEQEGDEPVLVVAMLDETCNPPAGEEHSDGDVEEHPVLLVQVGEAVALEGKQLASQIKTFLSISLFADVVTEAAAGGAYGLESPDQHDTQDHKKAEQHHNTDFVFLSHGNCFHCCAKRGY